MVDVAHRAHGTAAIHIAADVTTMDVDLGLAPNVTRIGVVGVAYSIVVRIVFVRAAACAVHVAAIREFVGQEIRVIQWIRGVRIMSIVIRRAADGAAIDIDLGFQINVAVFTGAIHRTFHRWTSLARLAYINKGVGDIGQSVKNVARGSDVATARTIHHAVLVAVGAYGAAEDVQRSLTATKIRPVFAIVAQVGAYRSHGTTAIYVMVDISTIDGEVGVAEYATSSDAELLLGAFLIAGRSTAAGIHVAVPAAQGITNIGVRNSHIGMTLYVAIGCTAIHTVQNIAASDVDMGVAHVGHIHHLIQKA